MRGMPDDLHKTDPMQFVGMAIPFWGICHDDELSRLAGNCYESHDTLWLHMAVSILGQCTEPLACDFIPNTPWWAECKHRSVLFHRLAWNTMRLFINTRPSSAERRRTSENSLIAGSVNLLLAGNPSTTWPASMVKASSPHPAARIKSGEITPNVISIIRYCIHCSHGQAVLYFTRHLIVLRWWMNSAHIKYSLRYCGDVVWQVIGPLVPPSWIMLDCKQVLHGLLFELEKASVWVLKYWSKKIPAAEHDRWPQSSLGNPWLTCGISSEPRRWRHFDYLDSDICCEQWHTG